MANIFYNGISQSAYDGILTFSDVHNILQVKEDVYGTKCMIELRPSSSWRSYVSADTQYSLTLFGETITNVMSPSDAKNKKFYIGATQADTAISMCRALRNCGTISADFVITVTTSNEDNDTVLLTAKTIGRKTYNGFYERSTIPTSVMELYISDGSADESDGKYINSKIDVDIYQGEDYITTLEKNFYGNECSFDVTPVLATLTEPSSEQKEQVKKYSLNISKLAEDGSYSTLGSISGFTTNGFLANQSQKYLPLQVQVLSNNKITDRGNILYVYGMTIPFSVLTRVGDSGGFSVNYTIYNSAMEVITSTTETYRTPYGDASIMDLSYNIPPQDYYNAHCIDVEVGSQVMRFYVIKPLKAAESWQRILWRNEYGGISFFDFTSSISESDSIEIETYEKNVFDFYDTMDFERKKIYSNKVGKTVKLKSHMMQKNGKYIFNSLARSKKVWTVVNDTLHFIIPKSIEVTEDGSYNDIYTATFQYEYSDLS